MGQRIESNKLFIKDVFHMTHHHALVVQQLRTSYGLH